MSELRPDDQARLRRALNYLDETAPLAPDLADLATITAEPQKTQHRSIWTAAAAFAVTLAALTPLLLLGGESNDPSLRPIGAAPTTPESTTTTAAATTTAPEQGDVVAPIDIEAVAAEFLEDIPLPSGLDPSQITTSVTAADLDHIMEGEELPPGVTRTEIDRYMIGAHVAGAATCAWIEVWLDSTEGGDPERADEAVAALNTSRSWAVLAEMNPIGDFPEVVWEYADAVAGDGTVPAGYPGATVADTYEAAFGCRKP